MTATSLEGLRVLVVEDEALLAEELSHRLSRLGLVPVEIVDSGARAVDAACAHQPDLILMDIRLKGTMDGIEATELISRKLSVPTVFLTAHSDRETLRRAKDAQPYGYVLKPFNERDLIVTLEMAVLRHKLDRERQASEERFAATLSSIGDGVISVDPEGKVTFVNPVAEQLTGWTLEEARGLPSEDLLHLVDETTREPVANPLREALELGQPVRPGRSFLLINKLGEEIPLEDSAAPILDKNSTRLGAVMAFQDARARRQAAEKLRKAQEQLQMAQRMETIAQLSGGLAHDFNNLLTVISCHAELLLIEENMDASSRALVDEIRRAGKHGASITRQLLSFSRQQVLQLVPLNLGKLMDEVGTVLARLLGQHIKLTLRYDSNLWNIEGDAGQLEQVLLNLAINARDAMPRGGDLTFQADNILIPGELGDRSPFVKLTVTDSGAGIEKENLERIFEPFFTTKDSGAGSGLGLPTVQAIVVGCGGRLSVRSQVGEGTVFELCFPALKEDRHDSPPDEESLEEAVLPPVGSEVVLLVDDQASVRNSVSKVLTKLGYLVYTAANADEAERLFRQRREEVQLVLTDVEMPSISGHELADRLRGLKPSVKILFLSGHTRDVLMRKRFLSQKEQFLQKPFTVAALTQKVRQVLGEN